MGFIKAFAGALGGTFADQWIDFYTIPNVQPTAALFPAVKKETDGGRGSNTKGSDHIISNGSKIIIPEGYGLITMQDGAITGLVAEPGGYTWQSDDVNSSSIFAGDGILSPLIKQTWERFKRGGIPGSQQAAFYVNLKELPNNRFGTQSEIYWDDAWLGTQVGALTRGSYTLKIVDPILFVKNYVPATYLTGNAVFDFTDMSNDAATQLFNEVVSALAPAFSKYTNDPARTRITHIQSDSLGFAKSLGDAVEEGYDWKANRGLEIVSTAIISIEYDADTTELLSKVKRADALSGARGNSNLQASVAQGIESAGSSDGGGGNLLGVGMAAGSLGGLAGLQQPVAPAPAAPAAAPAAAAAAAAAPAAEDPMAKLTQAKQMLDAGLITQEDYDAVKAKVLGG